MRRKALSLFLAALLLLPGCAKSTEPSAFTIVCTTYPVYVLASTVTKGVHGVAVERLDTGSGSCLHDYTLSVNDMKKLERANVIAMNGAGLEDFMADALSASDAVVIDCSEKIELLEATEHVHAANNAADSGHWDPHYWMDLNNLLIMLDELRDAMVVLDPEHTEKYDYNTKTARSTVGWEIFHSPYSLGLKDIPSGKNPYVGLITFHDGFQYFAKSIFIPLLASVEEEAGSEASAQEITEITELVETYRIPVIFTEENGSDSTAQAIARETGCSIKQLSLLMDGPESGDILADFLARYAGNLNTVYDGFIGDAASGDIA